VDQTDAPYTYASEDPVNAVDPNGLGALSTISAVSGVVAVVSASTGLEPLAAIAGGVSLVAGGLAAANDAATCNWSGFALDATSLAFGLGAEVQTVRVIGYAQDLKEIKNAEQAAANAGDISAVLRFLSEGGAVNTARQIPKAWGGILGWLSVGPSLAGQWLQP